MLHIKSSELHLKQYLEGKLNLKNAFLRNGKNNNDYKGN